MDSSSENRWWCRDLNNHTCESVMKYVIDSTYCLYCDWVGNCKRIVLMYFINGLPFTFDELEDLEDMEEDQTTINIIADYEKSYNTEELYNYHSYLMAEEFHPLVFEMELENPEDLPDEIDSYIEEDL